MICKHCGMESTTTDRCSVCGLPLQAPTPAEEQKAPQPTPSEQELQPKSPAAKAHRPAPAIVPPSKRTTPAFGAKHVPAPAVPPPSRRVASLEQILEAKSQPSSEATPAPAYSKKAPDPLAAVLANLKLPDRETDAKASSETPSPSTLPADGAATAPPTPLAAQLFPESSAGLVHQESAVSTPSTSTSPSAQSQAEQPVKPPSITQEELQAYAPPNPWPITARYAAVLAIMLAITGVFPLYSKALFWLPMVLTQFFGGLLLPVMRVVPWADEDSDDLISVIALLFFFGPVISFVIYTLFSLIRRNTNPALVGCLIVSSLSLIAVQPAWLGHIQASWLAPFGGVYVNPLLLIKHLAIGWSPILTIIGWVAAGVFHKLYE